MNLTKTRLKHIIKEELTKLLLEQEAGDKAWVGMNSAQVKKEMAKAGVKYGPGWASKLPKEHPVRVKYRKYWEARHGDQGAPAATAGGGQKVHLDPTQGRGKFSSSDAFFTASELEDAGRDAELRMASGLHTDLEGAIRSQTVDVEGEPVEEPVVRNVVTDPMVVIPKDMRDEYEHGLSDSEKWGSGYTG